MTIALGLSVLVNLALVLAFLHDRSRVEDRHDRRLAKLLDRIQAPETAVALSVGEDLEPVPSLPFDDDLAMQQAMRATHQ